MNSGGIISSTFESLGGIAGAAAGQMVKLPGELAEKAGGQVTGVGIGGEKPLDDKELARLKKRAATRKRMDLLQVRRDLQKVTASGQVTTEAKKALPAYLAGKSGFEAETAFGIKKEKKKEAPALLATRKTTGETIRGVSG